MKILIIAALLISCGETKTIEKIREVPAIPDDEDDSPDVPVPIEQPKNCFDVTERYCESCHPEFAKPEIVLQDIKKIIEEVEEGRMPIPPVPPVPELGRALLAVCDILPDDEEEDDDVDQ